MIVRVILTPSERRELLRAVSVLGGDRYTNHVGHFQSALFASIDIASSVVRVQAMRVSAESNDLNSARVGFSSFRPRARDVDRYRARPRNRRKKFSQRASAASVSRVRPVVEASRARLRVPPDARAHAADVFSKRTNFSTRVLGYFKGHEPSMDLKSSKRQLKIFNARARTDRKGPQRLYFVRFFTTLMVYILVSVLYFSLYCTGWHRQEIRSCAEPTAPRRASGTPDDDRTRVGPVRGADVDVDVDVETGRVE